MDAKSMSDLKDPQVLFSAGATKVTSWLVQFFARKCDVIDFVSVSFSDGNNGYSDCGI